MSNGIRFLFISPNFDDMMKLKIMLEEKYNALQCDISPNYNSHVDLTQYCLLAVDVFSITVYPLELLTVLRHTAYIPIVVLVPQTQIESEKNLDILFSQLYECGADVVLPQHLPKTVVGLFGAYYRRHVFLQHQELGRHHTTMVFQDEIIIEPRHRRVTVRGKEVKLTYKEFELLNYLACNADIVLTHDMIADRIWGSGEILNSTISSAITRLRQKVEPDPRNPTYIESIYGGGYRFKSYINELWRNLR